MIHSKKYWISDTEYDPARNLRFLFQVGAGILKLLFLYDFLVNGTVW